MDRGVVTYDRVRNAVFIPLSTCILHSRLEAKLSALTYTHTVPNIILIRVQI